MIGFIVRRLIQAVFITLLVLIGISLLVHLLPGGPAKAILGPRANATQVAAFNQQYGLDKPLPVQIAVYIGQVTGIGPLIGGQGWHPDLGDSYRLNQSVISLLALNIPKSLLLVGLSYAVAIIIAIPLGIYQAVRRNKPDDYILTGASFLFYSMPVFWIGILLIGIFSFTLHLLPSEGPQGSTIGDLLTQLPSLILPVITLSLITIASFSRYMRSSTLENMVQDYVRTARAKGASSRRVLFVHILRNALIPIITLIGISFGAIFSGALITEALFNYPGLGLLFWQEAIQQDIPVILGVIIVASFGTILGNLLADIMYAVADPRVRLSR
jgi:peptide/nickel transport system permease protein